MPKRFLLVVATTLVACDHSAPFVPGDYSPDVPLSPGVLARLTYSSGNDRSPTWLPGGAGILYSAQRLDRADGDHCLGLLPPGGGAVSRWLCRTASPDDSLNALEDPSFGPDGQLAYVRASAPRIFPMPLNPFFQELVITTLANPASVRVLRTVPYTSPTGRQHQAISHIEWLSPTRLAFLGESVDYVRECGTCVTDTVRTGREIVTLDFAAATPVIASVPGTDSASSLAAGTTGDTVYFTLNGNSRLFRYAFSSGVTDTVHDFAPFQNVRDIRVRGNRIFAVLDGRSDLGGDLHVLDLGTGVDDSVPPPSAAMTLWYRRPALSPDGTRLVAQARIIEIVPHTDGAGNLLFSDTLVHSSSDIWLYTIP